MSNPLHNIWFLLAIILTIVSITIRASTDKNHDVNVWYAGLNYALITAIVALVCLIVGIREITP
jgi:heme/copper-type cytochrome/quinol oxidase subunit 4